MLNNIGNNQGNFQVKNGFISEEASRRIREGDTTAGRMQRFIDRDSYENRLMYHLRQLIMLILFPGYQNEPPWMNPNPPYAGMRAPERPHRIDDSPVRTMMND